MRLVDLDSGHHLRRVGQDDHQVVAAKLGSHRRRLAVVAPRPARIQAAGVDDPTVGRGRHRAVLELLFEVGESYLAAFQIVLLARHVDLGPVELGLVALLDSLPLRLGLFQVRFLLGLELRVLEVLVDLDVQLRLVEPGPRLDPGDLVSLELVLADELLPGELLGVLVLLGQPVVVDLGLLQLQSELLPLGDVFPLPPRLQRQLREHHLEVRLLQLRFDLALLDLQVRLR